MMSRNGLLLCNEPRQLRCAYAIVARKKSSSSRAGATDECEVTMGSIGAMLGHLKPSETPDHLA
jgi:hypothetical protein